MDRYFNLNGKLIPEEQTSTGLDSWAYRYGFGLFETMLWRDGAIQHAVFHWERLEAGMRLLKMPFPKNYREQFEKEILQTAEANRLSGTCRVRLQISSGCGSLMNAETPTSSFLIEISEWDHVTPEEGLRIGISSVQKHSGPYAHLKSCNALPYVLAAREARSLKLDDLLLINEYGRIVESSIANIFWMENGIIYTPALSEGCVAGTMRRNLLETLPEKGFQVKTARLSKSRLLAAEAVFLTNALRGIMPVKEIDGRAFSIKSIEAVH